MIMIIIITIRVGYFATLSISRSVALNILVLMVHLGYSVFLCDTTTIT
jgi:hypothetical protein